MGSLSCCLNTSLVQIFFFLIMLIQIKTKDKITIVAICKYFAILQLSGYKIYFFAADPIKKKKEKKETFMRVGNKILIG